MRRCIVAVLLAGLSNACIVNTDTIEGAQGDAGPPGKDGSQGMNGTPGMNGADGVSPFSYVDPKAKTDIYYNGGNVGIGTSTPTVPLDVMGGVKLTATSGHLLMYDADQNPTEYTRIERDNGALRVDLGSSNAEIMRLDDTGEMSLVGRVKIFRPAHSEGIFIQWPNADISIQQDNDVGAWAQIKSTAGNGIAIIGSEDVACLTVDRTTNRVGIGTLDISATAKLAKYPAQPFVCGAAQDGTIALTSKYKICVCNGSLWVPIDGSSPQCIWQ